MTEIERNKKEKVGDKSSSCIEDILGFQSPKLDRLPNAPVYDIGCHE